MAISLYSPDGRYDLTFLANYSNVNDAILRVKGVGDIRNLGSSSTRCSPGSIPACSRA